MENYKLVLPEHLNHFGYLFGGYLLQWVDEAAWICATREYPACRFVTVGMDRVEFRKSVRQGTILNLKVSKKKVGNTSVQYAVEVFADKLGHGEEGLIFTTNITFVCLNEKGEKAPIGETSGGPARDAGNTCKQ